MLDKSYIFAFAAGAVAGILGARYYAAHKEELDSVLQKVKERAGEAASWGKGQEQAAARDEQEAAADEGAAPTIEELEEQKERLEDLIAEIKASHQGGNDAAAGA